MTPADVETAARRLLNDPTGSGVPGRFSTTAYTDWIDQALKYHALHRPDLFAQTGEVRGAEFILKAPSDSIRLMDVLQARGATGDGWQPVNEVDYAQLVDAGSAVSRPVRARPDGILYGGSAWDQPSGFATGGRPYEWARRPKNPNGFVINPSLGAGGVARVEYARTPTLARDLPTLPDAFRSSMIACTVWLAESSQDQSVNTGRAEMMRQAFLVSIGAETESRVITDAPDDEGEGDESKRERERRF